MIGKLGFILAFPLGKGDRAFSKNILIVCLLKMPLSLLRKLQGAALIEKAVDEVKNKQYTPTGGIPHPSCQNL
jgi:hypothetical protein